MITMKELNPKGYHLTDEQKCNLEELHRRMNVIRQAYGKPMYVTSGVRSIEHHKRIYEEKARREGKTAFRIPMGSKHLSGQACDIYDPNGELKNWVLQNVELLEQVGLWCEDFAYTKGWVHFQSTPPRSGKRFFIP